MPFYTEKTVNQMILTELQHCSFKDFDTYEDLLMAFAGDGSAQYFEANPAKAKHNLENFDDSQYSVFHALDLLRQLYTDDIDLSPSDVVNGRIPEQIAQRSTMYAMMPLHPVIVYNQLTSLICQMQLSDILDDNGFDPDEEIDQKAYVNLVSIMRKAVKEATDDPIFVMEG